MEKKPKGKAQIAGMICAYVGFAMFAAGGMLSVFLDMTYIILSMVGFALVFVGIIITGAIHAKNKSNSSSPTSMTDKIIDNQTRYNAGGDIKKQNQDIVCQKCGRINNPGSKFCDQCGTKLINICPNCGNENPTNVRYCSRCGNKLDEE